MALVARNCSDQKVTSLRRNVVVPKPFLLKDFLMDDMSSCSSNGFKSYPRRQCCTTVRFRMDVDRNGRDRPKISSKPIALPEPPSARLKRSRSSLQRASVAVLNAVKLLPFPSVKSNGLLPRSLSRKLLKWKRNGKEEANRRCRLFGELLVERDEPSDENNDSTDTTALATSSNSFDEAVFGTTQDDVVVGVTETSPSSVQNAEVWQNHEEKEQFSPVSVLDCPFKDEEEEEESGSQFQLSLAQVEGGSKQKTRRFEGGMAQLEPLNLEKRLALSEHRTSISTNVKDGADVERRETEEELEALLDQVKSATCHPSNGADNLLLDFFRESLVEDNAALSEREALTLARDWVNGTTKELVVGWEVQEGREMYVKDMEKERGWRGATSFQEKDEVALELECEVWESLVNELLVDLF